MNTAIIGQGYNIIEDTSVGKELISRFKSNDYNSFTCLVAFASYGGISALSPYILKAKAKGDCIKIILGVDQKGTSKEALEEVLSWGVDARIYHTDSSTIFHPKIYLFESSQIYTLIVGSNNLTTRGLVQNIEGSLLITDAKEGNSLRNSFYNYWKGLLDGTEENLYPITQDLIDKLYADKVISTEEIRAKYYDNGEDEKDSKKERLVKFKKSNIQKFPEGFIPKRIIRVKKSVKSSEKSNDKESEVINESLRIEDEVLITEFSKSGDRWSQVNFPIKIFEDFFGAKRGDNSYNISLMNLSKEGELGAVVNAQSVTVASNNFRFELNCKETKLPYPQGDNRPIGIFIKISRTEFIYQVLMPVDEPYRKIKEYLYKESHSKPHEMKRAIVHVEAIHALYPELIV